jgi:hypothetical protein
MSSLVPQVSLAPCSPLGWPTWVTALGRREGCRLHSCHVAGMVLAGMVLGGMDSPGSGQNEGEDEIAHCNGTCYVFADCGFPTAWW